MNQQGLKWNNIQNPKKNKGNESKGRNNHSKQKINKGIIMED